MSASSCDSHALATPPPSPERWGGTSEKISRPLRMPLRLRSASSSSRLCCRSAARSIAHFLNTCAALGARQTTRGGSRSRPLPDNLRHADTCVRHAPGKNTSNR